MTEVFFRFIQITKGQAAFRQLDAAIDAFHRGDYDIAITLAAAAEGMGPTVENVGLFQTVIANPSRGITDKKQWIKKLNATRDWLKHPTDWLEQSRMIAAFEAAIFIFRAMDKVSPWPEKARAFKELFDSSPLPVQRSKD